LKRADKPIRALLFDPLLPPADLLQLVTKIRAHLCDQCGGEVQRSQAKPNIDVSVAAWQSDQ
jgi:hypothetical protein